MKPASFKLSLISAFVGLSLAQLSYSSTVRGDIDYQYFRDLAENKGKFYVGAKNVEIFNKQGDKIGIALENIPMIDFSVITRGGGYATLTKPQYIVSVEHNRGYRTVQFGDSGSENPDNHHFNYQLVSRNDYDPKGSKAIPGFTHNDYQTPRLHKLVTETAPAEQSQEKNYELYRDASIFPMFIRAGSGTQYILAEKSAVKEKLADPYAYLIGGTTLKLTSNNANTFVFKGNVFDDTYSPLSSHPQQGDSGSGMFAWDNRLNRWVYIATLQSGNDDFTVSVVNHPEYGDLLEQEDMAGTISDSGKVLTWTALGNSSKITGATAELAVDLADTSLPDPTTGKPHKPSLHHGKTLKISGDGNTLNLANNVNQGAGALYFSGNTLVTGANEMTTWLGAGISVDKNKNVEWQVHNPVGDRLSKIGEGTLTVSGKGKNLGSISVGDGTVILNQQAGENGEKLAFSEVGIVSGRPTVILNSADQVDPNSIYFGYRGGRLDLNGNSLTFNRIQNVDDGARIVNNNAGVAANISLVGQVFTANDVRTINFGEGYNADLFRSQGAYFVLENNAWKFISWNHDDAKKYVVEKKNKALENQLYAYNGYFGESDSSRENGKLNIHFKPINAGGKLLLTGGTALDGILSAENDAEIILSGRPIPYARQVLDENKKTVNKEIIKEGEWINRTFSATSFQAKDNGKIEVSRNVVEVNGNFNLSDNATAQVGFTQGKSQSCIRSDRTGIASCNLSVLSDKDLHSWQRTTVNSDIKLTQNARFELGSKADLIGTIESNGDSQINLQNGSSWVMTGNSNVNKLNVDNATITLDNNVGEPNTLNINSLSGSGVINFITYFAQTISDLINVEHASGAFKAKISQIGTPTNDQKIKLLEAKSENNFNFTLDDSDIVRGDFRYTLKKEGLAYYLSPEKTEEAKAREEAARKAAEEAEKARLAQEEAAARKAAEEAEKARLAQEEAARKAAEEAEKARLAQEEAARKAAEEAEKARLAQEEAARKAAEEAEKARLAQEEAARKAAEEAEKARLAQEEAERKAAEEAEKARLAQEEAARKAAEEAEKARLAQEEAARKAAEEAEKARLAQEEAARKAAEEAEKARLAQEEAARKAAEEAEKARLAQEEAARKAAEEAGKARAVSLSSELAAQTNAVLGVTSALYLLVRKDKDERANVWSKYEYQTTKYQSGNSAFKQDFSLVQVGAEKYLDDHNLVIGTILSQSRANNDFQNYYNGKGDLTMLSFYGKKTWENGIYVGVDGSIGRANNKLSHQSQTIKLARNVYSLGLTVGKTLEVASFNLQPSFGMRYHHLTSANAQLENTKFETDRVDLLAIQAGLALNKTFIFNELKVKPELGSYFVDASHGTLKTKLNEFSLNQNIGRYFKQEVGITLHYKGVSSSIHAGFTKGNTLQEQKFISLKVGYEW